MNLSQKKTKPKPKRYILIDDSGNTSNFDVRREAFATGEQLAWAMVFDNKAKFGAISMWVWRSGRWCGEEINGVASLNDYPAELFES